MTTDPLQKAETLLLEARLDDCLGCLREVLSLSEANEAHDDAFLLLAQYNKYASDERRGLLSHADADLTRNQLTHRTLGLIKHLRQHPDLLAPFLATQAQFSAVKEQKVFTDSPHWLPSSVQSRMARLKERRIDFAALWLDDSAMNQRIEAQLVRQLGVDVTVAGSTAEFRQALDTRSYPLHLSCIDLDREPGINGITFHQQLVAENIDVPTIFYIGFAKRQKGVPPFAFGITNSPVELLHLVMDVVERVV
jgi:CheY-like chemotaxis protein